MSAQTLAPVRNADLLRRVADQIERAPISWQQDTWGHDPGCGTVACIAGWAMILSGSRPPNQGELSFIWWDVTTRSRGSVAAQERLGLTGDECSLFMCDWEPRAGLTVPAALRLLADGAEVSEVSA